MMDFVQNSFLNLVKIICTLFAILGTPLAENISNKMSNPMLIHQSANSSNTYTTELENFTFAGGMISVDCLRCLCLRMSNCEPVGCKIIGTTLLCGYFRLSLAQWQDCEKRQGIHYGWKECSSNINCASKCLQNYMEMYLENYRCDLTCEGVSRDYYAGPNGCNNPTSLWFWESVQEVPGCKGVK